MVVLAGSGTTFTVQLWNFYCGKTMNSITDYFV